MVKLLEYGLMVIGISSAMIIMITRHHVWIGISGKSMTSFINCNHNVLLATIIILHHCRVRIFRCLKKIYPVIIQQALGVPLFLRYHWKHAKQSIIHGAIILLMY